MFNIHFAWSTKMVPSIFLLLSLLVLAVHWSANAQEPRHEAASDDVYEAVIRSQIREFSTLTSYCVSVNGKDASSEFLKRFNPLLVKGESGCRKVINKGGPLKGDT